MRTLNQEHCLLIQLSLCVDRSVQRPDHCRRSTSSPIDLPLHSSVVCKQVPKILKLLYLGQNLFPNSEKALYHFPVQDHGLDLEALILILAASYSAENHSSESWRSHSAEANRTTSSAKSRNAILR